MIYRLSAECGSWILNIHPWYPGYHPSMGLFDFCLAAPSPFANTMMVKGIGCIPQRVISRGISPDKSKSQDTLHWSRACHLTCNLHMLHPYLIIPWNTQGTSHICILLKLDVNDWSIDWLIGYSLSSHQHDTGFIRCPYYEYDIGCLGSSLSLSWSPQVTPNSQTDARPIWSVKCYHRGW